MSKYRVYSGPYFPVFGLNNSAFGHFSRSDNHEKNVYVKFDNNISKAVTKKYWNSRNSKGNSSYHSLKSYLFFGGPSTQFLISFFLVKKPLCFVI